MSSIRPAAARASRTSTAIRTAIHAGSVITLALALMACEPRDRTPGTWLSGDLVETPVDDWTFTDSEQEVHLQTHPWYGIPHSVTVVLARDTGSNRLYVPSIYAAPAEFPGNKYWNRVVAANPEVLLQVAGKRYPRHIRQVTDTAEFERAFTALASKYPFWKQAQDNPDKRPPFVILRLDPPT